MDGLDAWRASLVKPALTGKGEFSSALEVIRRSQHAEPDEFARLVHTLFLPDFLQVQVFADWLEERGHEQADGWRALGRSCRSPLCVRTDRNGNDTENGRWLWIPNPVTKRRFRKELSKPDWWYDTELLSNRWEKGCSDYYECWWDAMDAAARAWVGLPDRRKAWWDSLFAKPLPQVGPMKGW